VENEEGRKFSLRINHRDQGLGVERTVSSADGSWYWSFTVSMDSTKSGNALVRFGPEANRRRTISSGFLFGFAITHVVRERLDSLTIENTFRIEGQFT
jgi:hypothetical protein